MSEKLLVLTSLIAVATGASAGISAGVFPYSSGTLSTGEAYVSFELQVTVTGDDAWTVAGGLAADEPWIRLSGGVFFQHPLGSDGPPDPDLFEQYPDLRYDSFYTSHLGWPNTDDQGVGGASGAINEPTRLTANWFWTPDGNFYPGTFTIARYTVIPDGPDWCTEVHVQVGSINTAPVDFYFGPPVLGCCPADLDGDWDVDLTDLALMLACYGNGVWNCPWEYDLDGDGDVDLGDLAELLYRYGIEC